MDGLQVERPLLHRDEQLDGHDAVHGESPERECDFSFSLIKGVNAVALPPLRRRAGR